MAWLEVADKTGRRALFSSPCHSLRARGGVEGDQHAVGLSIWGCSCHFTIESHRGEYTDVMTPVNPAREASNPGWSWAPQHTPRAPDHDSSGCSHLEVSAAGSSLTPPSLTRAFNSLVKRRGAAVPGDPDPTSVPSGTHLPMTQTTGKGGQACSLCSLQGLRERVHVW